MDFKESLLIFREYKSWLVKLKNFWTSRFPNNGSHFMDDIASIDILCLEFGKFLMKKGSETDDIASDDVIRTLRS